MEMMSLSTEASASAVGVRQATGRSTALSERRWPEHCAVADRAAVLADIYEASITLAVWQRRLSPGVRESAGEILSRREALRVSLALDPRTARQSLSSALAVGDSCLLRDDALELVEMFSDLFECSRVGLRITVLERAMCPRFHVDHLACRLITTYAGAGTEWLPHGCFDREKLGSANALAADPAEDPGCDSGDIHRLGVGDVALLKGEGWEGNEGYGLVHRSPAIATGERRLVLTLDIL